MQIQRARWLRGLAVALVAGALGAAGCSTTRSAGTTIDDSWITTRIKSKLAADPDVRKMNVSVQTDEGIVTLTGRAENETERQEAVKLTRNAEGVLSVRDLIEVGPRA